MKNIGEKQQNKLLQDQTFEYADYISRLVEYADIMEKEYYVIVPYDPVRTPAPNAIQSFFQRLQPRDQVTEIKKRNKEFEELRKKLTQRVNIVRTGLENCNLKTNELNTEEITTLLYEEYNPTTSRSVKIQNLEGINIQ